ncbi:hypothetical protein A1O3_07163 [Capronia epimyces CBS 606.96]|uniref:FAD/NAD(P)-binding domain-containing protein n=1 Tax=Capronia epimyces CBS 606.96 TaxID=1182542 RepID=W9XV77_9EURO|nr:uncharacterized protein A1O3_07163 [Capronia epimyces CBS 606.96]EXJ80876.1 hypothetical protein A1O3_07163 [Capronia epimyces CBS 606.96]
MSLDCLPLYRPLGALACAPTQPRAASTSATAGHGELFDAVVVGSGAAGIATVGNILDHQTCARILWIDHEFLGGRVAKKYRDVSSNTKVSLFLAYINALAPFREIVQSTPAPNAVTTLESLDATAGCRLHYAADMLVMLSEGLKRHPNVHTLVGTAVAANLYSEAALWSVQAQEANSAAVRTFHSPALVLCTGSSPVMHNPSLPTGLDTKHINLDDALDRQTLRQTLPADKEATVGVIGSSHSAIVVLMDLYELATTSHPRLRIKWFTRRALTYAVEMDGWILRDNTGLKGASADFARAHLEDEALKASPVSRHLEKVNCSVDEAEAYQLHLPRCTHLVQAIGYRPDPVPALQIDNRPLGKLEYDGSTGSFQDGRDQCIPGLHGAGIAFPEKVVDPAGNVEYAVGMWKFMKYLRRVVPLWGIGK